MRIAVIADTHDRVPPHLPELIKAADEIWHLGDVCSRSVLEQFEELGPPLRVVRGNCDAIYDWPIVLDFKMNGLQIRLVHIPPDHAPPGVDLLLHGHTHRPRNERVGTALFLNPGCVTRPNQGAPPSFGWLTLETGRPPGWELVSLL